MILDNRQVVPDIIVSRDGVPNHGLPFSVNINNNNNQNQGGRIIQAEKYGSAEVSPRHFSKGRIPRDAPIIGHPYATGNNNGSPRHVPHNGNYYNEAKGVYSVNQVANRLVNIGSPLHNRIRNNLQDSPRHSQQLQSDKFQEINPPGSPVHKLFYTGSPVHFCNDAPKGQGNDAYNGVSFLKYGSPRRLQSYQKACESPIKVQNRLNDDRLYRSPVHHILHAPEPPRNISNVLYSPKHTTRYENPYMQTGEMPTGLPRSPRHNNLSKSFRTRSSSHPCDGGNLSGKLQSKIPVHISNAKARPSSADTASKLTAQENVRRTRQSSHVADSPCRNLNKQCKTESYCNFPRNCSFPEFHKGDLKVAGKDAVLLSPLRSRNCNNLKKKPVTVEPRRNYVSSQNCQSRNINRRESLDRNSCSDESSQLNLDQANWTTLDSSGSWNIDSECSLEENDDISEDSNVPCNLNHNKNSRFRESRLVSWPSSGNIRGSFSDCEEDLKLNFKEQNEDGLNDRDSGVETDGSSCNSKMVLIKCKDTNYLTRLYVNNEGIHGLRVVGRIGVGGPAQGYVMNLDHPPTALGDFNSNHSACSDDVIKSNDVTSRDVLSENTTSFVSQATDAEFEHEAADYQWLLDYEYRESYSRESLGSGRDGISRVSVLQHTNEDPEFSYETFSRNIDANLAEIDMDDFRSEDINQLLVLPNICAEFQNASDEELYCSLSGSLTTSRGRFHQSSSGHSTHCLHHQQQMFRNQHLHQQQQQQEQVLQQQQRTEEEEDEEEEEEERLQYTEEEERQQTCYEDEEHEEIEEEFSGVSGDVSLYQSGPLFSPLRDPPQIPPSFSVDSLDSDSIHEDLILTCQANKDNYTIAFEGSFVQYSENSDSNYQEPGDTDTTGSGASWSADRLEGRSPVPHMTHSDQPYTTWSHVSRRSSQSRTPDPSQTQTGRQNILSPAPPPEKERRQPKQNPSSKSNSMPNLMRRSLMKRSLETTTGQCIKVYDLQNSLRSSQLSNVRSVDGNNFSLMRLFMKQKSLSKEAVSLSSSCTDPSQEGACSTSENQSGVNDSSDWPMNSQSENDTDGSASPVPVTATNNHIVNGFRRRGQSPNIMTVNPDYSSTRDTSQQSNTNTNTDGIMNNNNITTHRTDNVNSNTVDNVISFEDSLKEPNPCSKPPMTSPIREEPEGMDISVENKVILDQSEKEMLTPPVLRLKDAKTEQNNIASFKARTKETNITNNHGNKNSFARGDKQRSRSPSVHQKEEFLKKDAVSSTQQKRQDSGYSSHKGSTEKIKRSSDSEKMLNILERPKPKPRSLKQVADQCLQTSNLKVSATVNTSGFMEKKEVYVYYPNYALPDLGFLREKKYSVDARIFLVPQHYTLQPQDVKLLREKKSKRPLSCGDMEKLRRQGFGHIKDWESLNFLLPKELKEMLLDESECMETTKPSFCNPQRISRGTFSCDYTNQRVFEDTKDSKGSSNSLNSTQPSSGFRGSSTMLNDSEGESGNDPRYVYKYETGNTETEESDNGPPLPKRSVSLHAEERVPPVGASDDTSDIAPPRPPLPRGILRKCTSLRDEAQRQGVVKRHSSGDTSKVSSTREDLLKRRSLQEPIDIPVKSEDGKEDTADKNGMGCSCVSHCTGFCAKGLRKKNLLQVTELPEVSSHEDMTDADIARLRSQVSEFLVAKGNTMGTIFSGDVVYNSCSCPRKSVSFAEKECAHRIQEERELSGKPSSENTEQVRKRESVTRSRSGCDMISSIQRRALAMEDDPPPMLYDAHDKKTLVLSVRAAVEKLVRHFSKCGTQQEKNVLGSSQSPEVAHLALEKLCPAIYALLSDGLLPSLHSLFGKISNSVWRVVEATSQMGPATKALNDLVLTLNSEECLSEGPIKFNAFVFGLLNIRSLDAWLGYLRTRESALQKHYHPESFLYLSNTAMRGLFDDLLLALRPLALLPFRLDLLHEYKALHASLLKMEERLALQTTPSPSDAGASLDITLIAKESKELRNAAARTTERSRSPRPRSCHENTGIDSMPGVLKKRWSGVQLGSKFVTAIDRLMMEEGTGSSSGDYTDSLDNPRRHSLNYASDDAPTDMRVSDLSSKDGDFSERSATDKDTDTEKGLRLQEKENETEGEKFRRLQLKWEAMTNLAATSNKAQLHEEEPSDRPEKSVSPSGVQRSRIPRPVSITSPQQIFKPFEPAKEKTSPQVKQNNRKSFPSASPKEQPKPAPRKSLKDRVLPTDHSEIPRGPSVRSRLGPRISAPALTTLASVNRASSVPSRKHERGSSGSRYESQRKRTTHRSASQGRKAEHASKERLVQTLHHRLATDNGHLSFSRGDVLTVIVDVDERFLLCCFHDRKGLVPKTSVMPFQ